MNIEGNGNVHTIVVTKHLDNDTKCLEVLLFYNFVNGITNEEEDMLLVIELKLFIISAITLPKPKILVVVTANAKIDIDLKIDTNNLIFDFPHTLGEILVNTTST